MKRPWRWTDIHDDPGGFVEVEIEVKGPRVVAEMLAEAYTLSDEEERALEPAAKEACKCDKCRKIAERVRRRR